MQVIALNMFPCIWWRITKGLLGAPWTHNCRNLGSVGWGWICVNKNRTYLTSSHNVKVWSRASAGTRCLVEVQVPTGLNGLCLWQPQRERCPIHNIQGNPDGFNFRAQSITSLLAYVCLQSAAAITSVCLWQSLALGLLTAGEPCISPLLTSPNSITWSS